MKLNLLSICEQVEDLKKSSFVSFKYENSDGELAIYNLILKFNYQKLLERDIQKIKFFEKSLAQMTVLQSLQNSLDCIKKGIKNEKYTAKNSFIQLGNGLKYCKTTKKLYVSGLLIKKKVLKAGIPRIRNSNSLNKECNEISRKLGRGKFRQFILGEESLREVKILGKTLVLS